MGKTIEELRVLIIEVIRWARDYDMELNENKTEIIALNTRTQPRIEVNRTIIHSSQPTYLGVTLDGKLKGGAHL